MATAQPVRWEDQQRWWEQCAQENHTALLLRAHLSFMVPLRIMELRQQGGPTPADYERVRGYVCHPGFFWGADPPACVGSPPPFGVRRLVPFGVRASAVTVADALTAPSERQTPNGERQEGSNTLLCHGAEALLFPADFPKEVAAEWRRNLVDALAVLAFAPAGVHLFGLAFAAEQV